MGLGFGLALTLMQGYANYKVGKQIYIPLDLP